MLKEKKNDTLYLKINPNDIDSKALFIIRKLTNFGFDAFLVGGCIRDLILRKNVNDWDIATQASVEEIIKSFNDFKIITVGKKHGTLLLIINQLQYQVSTFKSIIGIQPDLQSDLKCRDFTINSMAWNEKKGLVDLSKGVMDIREGIIRFTENAQDRIREDPLRMLRAIRLACELDFKVEKGALEGIYDHYKLLQKVSIERVRDEFIKILLSDSPGRGFRLLYRLKLLRFIMPELQKCAGIKKEYLRNNEDLFEYILNLLENLPSNIILRLCMILYFIKSISKLENRKEVTTKILSRIRFKNTVIKKVNIMTQENWETIHFSEKKKIRQLASRIGMENLEDFWELSKTFIKLSWNTEKYKLDEIKTGENNLKEILKEKPPVSFKDLAIKGKDLIELGYKEGKEIKDILNELLDLVLEKPELNQKEKLFEKIQGIKNI
ncbi:MAG: hypothetical protein U9N08_02960 [Candidatus Caldatribacteriota bacterium]|nr:hypothetical protein [Candidatus Caldatribacteriota bacterium]